MHRHLKEQQHNAKGNPSSKYEIKPRKQEQLV